MLKVEEDGIRGALLAGTASRIGGSYALGLTRNCDASTVFGAGGGGTRLRCVYGLGAAAAAEVYVAL